DRWAGNEFPDRILRFPAEGAAEMLVVGHGALRDGGGLGAGSSAPGSPDRQVSLPSLPFACGTRSLCGVNTLSIKPYALASSALMNRSRSMSRWLVSIGCPVYSA